MSNIKDKIWLWGQAPAGYDNAGYGLPKGNKMDPIGGLEFFGINNLCRVKLSAEAGNSFINDPWLGSPAKSICLSLISAGGNTSSNDIDDIIKMARADSRVTSAVMDDFLTGERPKIYTPEVLLNFKNRLNNEAGRKLELWSVLYEREFDIIDAERAKIFDVTTFWTWFGENLESLPESLKKMSDIVEGGRMMLGVYMYDFGNKKPLSDSAMIKQLEFAEEKLRTGEIEGIILCSNVIADIGLNAVNITKDWLSTL